MEPWRQNVSLGITAVGLLAAVFLAYSDLTEANAVQDVRIEIHDKALITLREDVLRSLDRIHEELRELRKEQQRKL